MLSIECGGFREAFAKRSRSVVTRSRGALEQFGTRAFERQTFGSIESRSTTPGLSEISDVLGWPWDACPATSV